MYEKLSVTNIKEFLLMNCDLFSLDDELEITELSNGNVNLIFRVRNTKDNKSFIVKQALPYLKIAGDSWPLAIDRNKLEYKVLEYQSLICKELVPKVYFNDEAYSAFVMEDCTGMEVLRESLLKMNKYPSFPNIIGEYLAKMLFHTSDLGLKKKLKKNMIKEFVNPDLCDITERLVFTEPYYNCYTNNINAEILSYVKKEIWNDELVCASIDKLRYIFMNKSEALIHGDLHSGSIFISSDKCKVFDSEFAFYGPISYDIGTLYANLIVNYYYLDSVEDCNIEKINDFRAYLLNTMERVWTSFVNNFSLLYKRKLKLKVLNKEKYKEDYLNEVLHETIGFCACEIMRRVIGLAHTEELDSIHDIKKKSTIEIELLNLSKFLVLNYKEFNGIDRIISSVDKSFTYV
ncbi:S-methyl-5-thioribose kinase [Clostridium faecium]|uniref:S-methyl-5-thioribose kinase n=1 Tax=Clostridium butanoliproducens TaxID=2991837 RepID=UPI0024BAC2B1|nr:S-methyl-5-thioribose kinase [Clostridium butanoliproducens]